MGVGKRIYLLVIFTTTAIYALAQLPDSKDYHQLADFPFVIVSDHNITTPPEIFAYKKVEPVQPADTVPTPVQYSRRHLIAIRTNLLHDFLYVPQFGRAWGANVQLEYFPVGGHFTYNAGFTFTNHRHWSDYKFFQIRDLQLELRRYFRGGGRHRGLYLGAYLEGTVYGIGFSNTKGWEGEGGGAGLSAGYTCRLNRKGSLRLEMSLSAGIFVTRYDPYIYNHPFVGYDDKKYYYDYYDNHSYQYQAANYPKLNE